MPKMEKKRVVANTEKEGLEKIGDYEIFFSKDPKYLKQYYKLRHDIFNGEFGWKDYDGSECRFDREGKIIIATQNDKVVGGMRLMFSNQCNYLSNEMLGSQYEYRKVINKYDDRENMLFGEISAVFVDESKRDKTVVEAMFKFGFKYAKDYGCYYVFGVAVPAVSRDYRRIFAKIGYDLEIMMNFFWLQKKMFNYVRLFPIYVKLK